MAGRAKAAKRMVVHYRRRDGTIATMREKRGKRNVSFIIRHCVQCGQVFYAVRNDAQTCSASCRQRLYRIRKQTAQAQHKQLVLKWTETITKGMEGE